MTRRQEDIHTALDKTLSFVSRDPALFSSVVKASKGDTPPMKRKLTLSMALALVLILITATVAVAAACHGVTYFLQRDTDTPVTLNPDYLMQSLQQTYTGRYLDGRVVDAYWDGANLSVACHFTPKDENLTLARRCDCRFWEQPRQHVCPNETADLTMAFQLQGITVSTENETTHPFRCGYHWEQETDKSLSVMPVFVVNDLSKPVSISLPITVYVNSTGETEESLLHFSLSSLPDPVPAHQHEWIPARCVNPQTCSVCGRTQGGLGKHDYAPATCIAPKTCTVCGTTTGTLSLRHPYDANGVCPLCGKVKRQSAPTP